MALDTERGGLSESADEAVRHGELSLRSGDTPIMTPSCRALTRMYRGPFLPVK